MSITPDQKKHLEKSNGLLSEAAQIIEHTKAGHSGAAAKVILEANIEKQKAGLIKGKLQR